MATFDTTTDIGKVRLLIRDLDQDNPTFEDEDIQAFIFFYDNEPSDKMKLVKTARLIIMTVVEEFSKNIGQDIQVYRIKVKATSEKAESYRKILFTLDQLIKGMEALNRKPLVFSGGQSQMVRENNELNTDIIKPSFISDQFDFNGDFGGY